MISILIGIDNIGVNAGPFDLYSDVDNFTTPFETGISKAQMEIGYVSNSAPDNSTIVRVKSNGVCDNSLDIPIASQPTTTSTTTTTLTPTTTTSTTTIAPTTTSTTTTIAPTTTSTTTTIAPTTIAPTTIAPTTSTTTTTTSTTTTTTLNRELTITDVTFDSQFRVFFESNFGLTTLAYEISNNGTNWNTPTLIDIDSPQVFSIGLFFESFFIRIFDNDSGIVTYSNDFLYTEPVTTNTTTIAPQLFQGLISSTSLANDPLSPSSPDGNPCELDLSYDVLIEGDPGDGFIGSFIRVFEINGITPFDGRSSTAGGFSTGGNRWWKLTYLQNSNQVSLQINGQGDCIQPISICF